MLTRVFPVLLAGALSLAAQQATEATPPAETKPAETKSADAKPAETKQDIKNFQVETNTRIPLSMINSVSTKNAAPGDRVYLETVFPILVDGRIVIPPGSYVAGTITKVQRPGKVKGRGEFYLRFDSLTLPNGVTRDFRARVSGLDGRASEELDRNEGSIKSEGNKSGRYAHGGRNHGRRRERRRAGRKRGGATGMGAGIGAAAGAAAGLAAVLFTRGPDAVLAKGTTIEMVLDRNVEFNEIGAGFLQLPGTRNNVGRRQRTASQPEESRRCTQALAAVDRRQA